MTFDPTEPELAADEVQDLVDETIESHEIALFMKGDARMPQCGYSERAVKLVAKYRDDAVTVDTLQNLDAFRDALEEHSGWDTIPQTFVDGDFVGGSDILAELEERGDLAEKLNAEDVDIDPEPTQEDGVDAPF